jgi:hypothetical protein
LVSGQQVQVATEELVVGDEGEHLLIVIRKTAAGLVNDIFKRGVNHLDVLGYRTFADQGKP